MDSIRKLILAHHTTSDVHITTHDGEQHRVIGVNANEVIVHGDRDNHIEAIPFTNIKDATAYGVGQQ